MTLSVEVWAVALTLLVEGWAVALTLSVVWVLMWAMASLPHILYAF